MVLGLLCSLPTLATPVDSILVRIGPKSKVLFYSPSREELKKLENYDWNTILKDLNARLSETTRSEPRQHYIDLSGKSFLSDSSLRGERAVIRITDQEADKPVSMEKFRSDFQKFRELFQLNLVLGWPSVINLNESGSSYPTYLDELHLRPSSSRRYGINIIRPIVLQPLSSRVNLIMDLGLEFSLTRFRTAQPFYYREVGSLNNGLPDGTIFGNNEKIVFLEGYGRFIHQPLLKRTYNATYLDLIAVPTFQFYNKSGQRTYQAGLGFFFGPNMGNNQRTVFLTNANLRYPNKGTSDFHFYPPFPHGLILKLAYRDFAIVTRFNGNFHGLNKINSRRICSINLQIPLL